MATYERDILMQHKTGNDTNLIYPVTRMDNIADCDFVEAAALAALVSGEDMPTLFGKLMKAVNSEIDHINARGNVHNATATDIGAVPAERIILADGTDLNTVTEPGHYGCTTAAKSNTITNKPSDAEGWSDGFALDVVLMRDNGAFDYSIMQVIKSQTEIWTRQIRIRTPLQITAWERVFTSAGGTLTGPISLQIPLGAESGGTGRTDGKAQGLVTPRKIGSADFDGTAPITLEQIGALSSAKYEIRTGRFDYTLSTDFLAQNGRLGPSVTFTTPFSGTSNLAVVVNNWVGESVRAGARPSAVNVTASGFELYLINLKSQTISSGSGIACQYIAIREI